MIVSNSDNYHASTSKILQCLHQSDWLGQVHTPLCLTLQY